MAPRKPKDEEASASSITNDSDQELYYPALGVTLKPGESVRLDAQEEKE